MGKRGGGARRARSAAARSDPAGRRFDLWLGFVLFAAILLAYQPAWHGGFLFEDEIYAKNNPFFTVGDGLRRMWFTLESPSQYFPLTHSAFMMQHALWGASTTGYHFVNIILHAFSALILWMVLRRLEIPGAWFGAALFALHPVQVESVAQISELKNVLSGVFFMGALFFWASYAAKGEMRSWVLAFLCALLALAAKTTVSVLPAPLLLIFWWRSKPLDRRFWLSIAPFVIASGLAGLAAFYWERAHNVSKLVNVSAGPIERILIASRAIFFYLSKLAWPSDLMFSYPRWDISRLHPQDYIWPAAFVLLVALILALRRRLGRGPEVALLFFVSVLLPLLGLVSIYPFRYTFVADHYQYLACIGPLALFAAAVHWLLRDRGRLPAIISAVLVAIVAGLTWNQAHAFANAEALWTDTIRKNPQSWMAENNYGVVLLARRARPEALTHFQRSYELNSANNETDRNMGQCLLELQQPDAARIYLEQAVSLNPQDGQAHRELARALLQVSRPDDALTEAAQALTIDPNDAKAHILLSSVLVQQGRVEEGLEHLKTAMTLKPDDEEAQSNMASLLLQAGRQQEASQILEQILARKPDDPDALKNCAWILATASDSSLRDGARAVTLAQRAYEQSPQNPFIQATLAAAYAEAGRFEEASATAERALAMAESNNLANLSEILRNELTLFQNRQPVRSTR